MVDAVITMSSGFRAVLGTLADVGSGVSSWRLIGLLVISRLI
jgi:hypothetical protein